MYASTILFSIYIYIHSIHLFFSRVRVKRETVSLKSWLNIVHGSRMVMQLGWSQSSRLGLQSCVKLCQLQGPHSRIHASDHATWSWRHRDHLTQWFRECKPGTSRGNSQQQTCGHWRQWMVLWCTLHLFTSVHILAFACFTQSASPEMKILLRPWSDRNGWGIQEFMLSMTGLSEPFWLILAWKNENFAWPLEES